MGTSSRRIDPGWPSLRLVMQPSETGIRWTLMKINRWNTAGRDSIIASGHSPLEGGVNDELTARTMIQHVLASLPPQAEPPASPSGDHRGDPTLDLDFTP